MLSWLNTPLAKKVPELTLYFWVVILAAPVLGLVVLIQLAMHRYNAWIYWLAVSMVAVFGTMAAGIVHV